jgi:integrase
VRGRIERVLDWAKANGHRSGENPAAWRGHLAHSLPPRAKVRAVKHHPALSYADLPAFMAALRGREGVATMALQFTILTAARTGETLGARWEEIDVDRTVWTVPAARMKGEREHRVPLAGHALAVLYGMLAARQCEFVFPGQRPGRPLHHDAMAEVLERMKRDTVTIHGFRSTFRDWAAETTNFPSEVVEMALAHAIGDKVEAAYRRGDLFEKRRVLMQQWGLFCDQQPIDEGTTVVPIRASA